MSNVAARIAAMEPTELLKFLQQFTRWGMKWPLSPEDYYCTSIQLVAAILSGTTTGQVKHNCPSNFVTLIFGIEGHLAFNLPASETLSVTNLGNLTVQDRVLLKAMNTRLALQNENRKAYKYFETADKPLSAILKTAGGTPLEFMPPIIASPADVLVLDISTQSTESTIVGASTNVGVDLHVLRVRASE